MIMEIAIKIIMIKMTTMGSSFQLFSGTIGIWSVGFCGWSETGGPGEKPGKTEQRGENHQQNQPTRDARFSNQVLSPLCHPLFPVSLVC